MEDVSENQMLESIPDNYSALSADMDAEDTLGSSWDPESSLELSSQQLTIEKILFPKTSLPEPFAPITPQQQAAVYLQAAKKTFALQEAELQEKYQKLRSGIAAKLKRYRACERYKAQCRANREAENKVGRALIDLELKYNEIVGLASKECLETVHKICRMVLHRELQTNNDTLRLIIERELQGLQFRRIQGIKVHPSQEKLGEHFQVPFIPVDTLAPDEARIMTASGEIQISLSEDLGRIIHELESLIIQQQEGITYAR